MNEKQKSEWEVTIGFLENIEAASVSQGENLFYQSGFRPCINIRPEGSDHNWTAPSPSVHILH